MTALTVVVVGLWIIVAAWAVGGLPSRRVSRGPEPAETSVADRGRRGEPSETVLLASLEYVDRRVSGVTRLDQQLVYVPLVALGGLVTVAAGSRVVLSQISESEMLVVALAVWVGVGFGLLRNERRHRLLRRQRERVLRELGGPVQEVTSWADSLGRPIYFALFTLGLAGVARVLSSIAAGYRTG